MNVIHLRRNPLGIELVDDDDCTLIERVTGRAVDAALTLQQAVNMIEIDDDKHLPVRVRLSQVLAVLRFAIREIDQS